MTMMKVMLTMMTFEEKKESASGTRDPSETQVVQFHLILVPSQEQVI